MNSLEKRKGLMSISGLSGLEKRRLTVNNIAETLLLTFRNHVGRSDAISRAKLYKHLFKRPYNDTLADFVRWDFVGKALHILRQRSNCFITCELRGTEFYYFVVSTDQEAEIYVNRLENSIKKMRSMQKRAVRSVEERWYEQQWQLPGKRGSSLQVAAK